MRKSQYLLQKKEEAHLLIHDIECTGLKKSAIYERLSKKMGMTREQCHFSKMKTTHDVERAIFCLEEIFREWKREKKKRRLKKLKKRQETQLFNDAKAKVKKVLDQKEMQSLTTKVKEQNDASLDERMIERHRRHMRNKLIADCILTIYITILVFGLWLTSIYFALQEFLNK